MDNIVILLLVIIFAVASLYVLFKPCNSSMDRFSPQYSTYLTTVGHPRFPGDYMDYTGEVPSEGGYVLESDSGNGEDNSYLKASLCQECMDNCVGLAEIHGLSGDSLESAKIMCQERCYVECDPNSGF